MILEKKAIKTEILKPQGENAASPLSWEDIKMSDHTLLWFKTNAQPGPSNL